MSKVLQHKVVGSLPAELEADSIYYVRTSTGFDQFVTNSSGVIVAYPQNTPSVIPHVVDSDYVDAGAVGGNPSAVLYSDGTIRGKTDYGRYVKSPDGRLFILYKGVATVSTPASHPPFYAGNFDALKFPHAFSVTPAETLAISPVTEPISTVMASHNPLEVSFTQLTQSSSYTLLTLNPKSSVACNVVLCAQGFWS